jgi:hypothetical protein
MAGVFKWGQRVAPAPPTPATSAPPADAPAITSKVFSRFMTALAARPSPVLIDLGPVVGANVSYFGERLGCKIFVEDLFSDVERTSSQGAREDLAATIGSRLAHGAESIDGILCWDLFDFLDKSAGQSLARRLAALLRPGGVLHGLFGTTPVELTRYSRYSVEGDDLLRVRTNPATPLVRSVIANRDLARMFDGLTVSESVLLKTNTRDTLLRK